MAAPLLTIEERRLGMIGTITGSAFDGH